MIKIVTDSTCDLPQELIRTHDIRVVPLYVRFGQQSFREGVEITRREFYEKMTAGREFPTTSQPSPGDFLGVYEKLAAEGHTVLSIHISGKLSGTVNSAQSARAMVLEDYGSARISIIDSLTASAGLGALVLEAAELAERNLESEEMVSTLSEITQHNKGMAMVADLQHLFRGGRISRSKAFIGGIMNMIPIIELESGSLTPTDRVRGKRSGVEKLFDYLKNNTEQIPPRHIATCTGSLHEEHETLLERIRGEFPGVPLLRTELGAVIGTHLGPESLVLMWF